MHRPAQAARERTFEDRPAVDEGALDLRELLLIGEPNRDAAADVEVILPHSARFLMAHEHADRAVVVANGVR